MNGLDAVLSIRDIYLKEKVLLNKLMNYYFWDNRLLRYIVSQDVRFILHLNSGVNDGCDTMMIKNRFPNSFIFAVEGDIKKYQSLVEYVKHDDNIITCNDILIDTDYNFYITLDTFFKRLSIPSIDILYVSYDNNIYDIFKGANNTFKSIKYIITIQKPYYTQDEVSRNEILYKHNFKELVRLRDEKKNIDTVLFKNMSYNDGPQTCPYIMKDDLTTSMSNMNIYDYISKKK